MSHSNGKRQRHLWQIVDAADLPGVPVTAPDSAGLLRSGVTPSRSKGPYSLAGSRLGILFSLLLIGLLAATITGITWGYFSDAASGSVAISTGNIDLLICTERDPAYCLAGQTLSDLTNLYPGWQHTMNNLSLHNAGSLNMRVSITGDWTGDEAFAQALHISIYRATSTEGTALWSGSIWDLEGGAPIDYGQLDSTAFGDLTIFFNWPDVGDQSGLAGQSLSLQITFYGTTEGVPQ